MKLQLTTSSSEVREGIEGNDSLNCEVSSSQSKEYVTIQNKLDEANKRIDGLEKEVLWLSKSFITKAYLQAADPPSLVAQVDPVKKVITSIEVDKSYWYIIYDVLLGAHHSLAFDRFP